MWNIQFFRKCNVWKYKWIYLYVEIEMLAQNRYKMNIAWPPNQQNLLGRKTRWTDSGLHNVPACILFCLIFIKKKFLRGEKARTVNSLTYTPAELSSTRFLFLYHQIQLSPDWSDNEILLNCLPRGVTTKWK